MPINPIYNDIEMKTAWAEDAATTIPSVPVPGIAYRNTGLSEETVGTGQQYDSIGRSADWNELLYKISANIITLQRGGATLLWISGRQYEQGSLVKDPNNAQIYYRKKAGAGTTRPSSDSTNWQLLQDLFCGEGLILNNNNKLVWGQPIQNTTNCNTVTAAGVYWVPSTATNGPIDIESSSNFQGFIVVTRTGNTSQQIAYEVGSAGFSMNTRYTSNNGSSWSPWKRFGVNFTLDWNSGHDYRVGDLVRDTSNSLLYVCTTAISNSTQRPGLDTGHFALLQSYLVGEGLEVIGNKITWGVSNAGYLSNVDVNTLTTAGTYRIGTTGVENAAFRSNHSMLVVKFHKNQVLQIAFISLTLCGPVAVRGITDINGDPTVGVWNYSSAFDSLDFISGRTYDIGQLVRGSNNVHYVKKTAASVCNTEPNSDSANFESLAANLIDKGLTAINNGIAWGYKTNTNITDCNTAKKPGLYYVTGSNLQHTPSNMRGYLIVITTASKEPMETSAQVEQLFIDNNNALFIRRSEPVGDASNITWKVWVKIGPAEEVSAADLAGNGLTAASNKLNWGTASNVTNANNVTTPGTYALTSSSTNTPTKNGIMLVVKKPDGTVSQVIFDSDTGKTYSRDKTGSAWSTWYSTTSSIGADMSAGKQNRSFGTLYTADTDGFIELTAYSNWRANTNGQLYINNNEIAVNHTGQYGSGGQSSGVQTTIYVRAGDTYECNQGSLEDYWWFPNT